MAHPFGVPINAIQKGSSIFQLHPRWWFRGSGGGSSFALHKMQAFKPLNQCKPPIGVTSIYGTPGSQKEQPPNTSSSTRARHHVGVGSVRLLEGFQALDRREIDGPGGDSTTR